MSRPICERCGTPGEIRHRQPHVYYCPTPQCPTGHIMSNGEEAPYQPCQVCTLLTHVDRLDALGLCPECGIGAADKLRERNAGLTTMAHELQDELANERERAEKAEDRCAHLRRAVDLDLGITRQLRTDLAQARERIGELETNLQKVHREYDRHCGGLTTRLQCIARIGLVVCDCPDQLERPERGEGEDCRDCDDRDSPYCAPGNGCIAQPAQDAGECEDCDSLGCDGRTLDEVLSGPCPIKDPQPAQDDCVECGCVGEEYCPCACHHRPRHPALPGVGLGKLRAKWNAPHGAGWADGTLLLGHLEFLTERVERVEHDYEKHVGARYHPSTWEVGIERRLDALESPAPDKGDPEPPRSTDEPRACPPCNHAVGCPIKDKPSAAKCVYHARAGTGKAGQ